MNEPGKNPQNPNGETHEQSDVRSRSLIGFMVVVLFAIAVIHVVIGGLGLLLYLHHRAATAPRSQLTTIPVVPPEPRLQSNPKADLDAMVAQERELQDSYTWVDRRAGVVRIPVVRAIDLVAQRGLPAKRHDIPTTAGAAMTTSTTPKGGQ